MDAGIHTINAATYHGDCAPRPSLSASLIHTVLSKSPLHAKLMHPRLTPSPIVKNAKVMDIGSAAHALLLENDTSKIARINAESFMTKAAKAERDLARSLGQIPILESDWEDVQEMAASARGWLDRDESTRSMFTGGKPEQTLLWFDKEYDVWCRARLDYLRDDYTEVDDYKTSATADPETATSRVLFSNGWHIKDAWYRRGLKILTGKNATFRFAVQETERPYALSVIAMGPEVQDFAERQIRYAMDVFRGCLADDVWPAYPKSICWAELPKWMGDAFLRQQEEESINE